MTRTKNSGDTLFKGLKIPDTLSKEEQFELLKEYKRTGNLEARNKFVCQLIPAVIKVATSNRGNKGFSYSIDDLCSVGVVGLIIGIEAVDISFSYGQVFSYLTRCIKEKMKLFRGNNLLPVNLFTSQPKRRVYSSATFWQLAYTDVSNQQIADELNKEDVGVRVLASDVESVRTAITNHYYSLNANLDPFGYKEKIQFQDLLVDQRETPDKEVESEEIKRKLLELLPQALEVLTDRERDVIVNYTLKSRMMTGEHPKNKTRHYDYSLMKIGRKYGLTRERMRQIQLGALKKMKNFLISQGYDELW